MSENTAVAEVAEKPAKVVKVATACACSEFSAMIDDVNVNTGCTAVTVNTFGPGHDAKLKSLLIKAAVANAEVTKTGLDGSFEGLSAYDAASLHGFGAQVQKSADARKAKIDEQAAKKAERDRKRDLAATLKAEKAEATKAKREAAKLEREEKARAAKEAREAKAAAATPAE